MNWKILFGRRRVLWTLVVLVSAAFTYHIIAGLWAYLVTPTVLTRAPDRPSIDLTALRDSTVEILVAVDDPSFFEHPGIDPFTPGQGLVTITRALVHMLYLDQVDLTGVSGFLQGFYRFVDKVAAPIDLGPDFMALALNARVSKNQQLRLFLEHVYMGNHEGDLVYGYTAAARAYYGKDVTELTRLETVSLVAMMIGPNTYHPVGRPERLAERVSRIERMLRGHCKPSGVRDVYLETCDADASGDA